MHLLFSGSVTYPSHDSSCPYIKASQIVHSPIPETVKTAFKTWWNLLFLVTKSTHTRVGSYRLSHSILNVWLPFLLFTQFSVCGPLCCRELCLWLLKTVLCILCSFLTSSNSFCFIYASFLMNKKAHGDSTGSFVYVIHQENLSSFLSANSQCGNLCFINLSTIFYIFLQDHQDFSHVL